MSHGLHVTRHCLIVRQAIDLNLKTSETISLQDDRVVLSVTTENRVIKTLQPRFPVRLLTPNSILRRIAPRHASATVESRPSSDHRLSFQIT